jgi:macrolide-specific efflux system membrane fusion protein
VRRLPSLLVNLLLAALALGAAGWATVLVRDSGTTKATAAAGSRTVQVAKGTVTATVSADGTLEPVTSAAAGFETSGTVTAVNVKVGQKVVKGQVLAELDPAAAKRALALAQANLNAAEDALARARAAASDTTAATNEVATARLAVTAAQAGVAATKLTAPMAGTVTAVNGTVGSSASVSAPAGGGSGASTTSSGTSSGFVEVADLTNLQVAAKFSEEDATSVKAGQTASMSWSALSGATATGQVLAVDPSATTSNSVVTYGVTLSIGALPTGARPGQSVTVTVTTGTAANVVMVNSAAVTVSGNRYTVTVVAADGTTETREVTVGVKGDAAYAIKSGLSPGEQVVVPETTATTSTNSGRDDRQPGFGGPGGGPP